MLYSAYKGTLCVRAGKGEDAPTASADISTAVPVGMDSDELFNFLMEKYGKEAVALSAFDRLMTEAMKIGRKALKAGEDAEAALVNAVNGDLTPRGKESKVKVTPSEIIAQLEAAGVSKAKIKSVIGNLLNPAEESDSGEDNDEE